MRLCSGKNAQPTPPEREDTAMAKKVGKFSSASQPVKKSHKGLMVAMILLFLAAGGAGIFLWLIQAGPSAILPASKTTLEASGTEPSETNSTTPSDTPPAVFTPAATGDRSKVSCKSSYTVVTGAADKTVATAGSGKLTNGMLQVLYLSQVNAWRAGGREPAPDFERSLDSQACPLAEGLSWQQYFLQRAVLSWQAQQAALEQVKKPRIQNVDYFFPNETSDLHGEYIAPDLPLNDFLFQDQDCYTPNSIHQAYLDGLGDTLDTLAQGAGFSSLQDMALKLNLRSQDFLQAAQDFNLAYMYFTEESYSAEPSDGEVAEYLQNNAAALFPLSSGQETVDIRQILLVPQDAQTDADGKITAAQQQWDLVQAQAEEILEQWEKRAPVQGRENAFAQLASMYSQDTGAASSGGGYYNLSAGQLIAPLSQWCFANGRQQGDCEILRSDYGLHIVYLSAFREDTLSVSSSALLKEQAQKAWKQWLKDASLSVDYSAAELWADTTISLPTLEDTLYPDIAHERFPEVIVYLQQDFFNAPFGNRYIGKNGCGIATFAMLATYMTDSYQTPPDLAALYRQYFDNETHGTNGDLFINVPCEMGFYLDKVSYDIEEVIQALKDGKMVISRQEKGYFTSSGHYILIQHYNQEDDTFQVRDSNVYNYGSKSGHKTDRFTRYNILSGGSHFYIIQPKLVSSPACARCGDPEHCLSPIQTQDYLCLKCAVALSRRSRFLEILEDFSTV